MQQGFPDLLGKAAFQGLRDPAVLQYPIRPDLGGVVRCNLLHLLLSLRIGLIVAALVAHSERSPPLRPASVSGIILSSRTTHRIPWEVA